jgi:outer membrane protein assembly factor BamB
MATRPSILFRGEVPGAWSAPYDKPVVGEGLLLLAAGWVQDPGRDCATTVLALDAVSGAPRWRLDVPVLRPGASACQVGLPATTVDGLVLVPVYQWDAAARVYVMDRRGETLRVDDLASRRERKLDVRSDDAQIKLLWQPLHIASGAYLVSWTYRGRDHHAQCRDLATGALRWQTEEVVLAADNGVAICRAAAPRGARRPVGGEIVARNILDGSIRWRLPGSSARTPEPTVPFAGMLDDALLLVDRRGVQDWLVARDEAVGQDTAEIQRKWEFTHPRPGDVLVAVDPGDGRERWRHGLDGQVRSIALGSRVACTMVALDDDNAWWQSARADGTGRHARVPPAIAGDAVVAAAQDESSVLVATADALASVPLTTPDRPMWRVPLPVDPRTVGVDSMARVSATLVNRRLYVRADTDLSAFVMP